MENQDQKPIDKVNIPLEELLSPEELAVIKEMRANVQIKDAAVMDSKESPLYAPSSAPTLIGRYRAEFWLHLTSTVKRERAPCPGESIIQPNTAGRFFLRS